MKRHLSRVIPPPLLAGLIGYDRSVSGELAQNQHARIDIQAIFRWCACSIALLSFSVWPANAQPTSFHGPISGFFYSSAARTVRPLLGVPGAAYIGSPVLTDLDAISVAPGGKWVFAMRSGRSTLMRGLADLSPVEFSIDGLIDAVDRVVWSRDGSAALFYSSYGNRLQRVRLSDSGALADAPVDVSPWGQVTTLAMDADGRQIVFGVKGAGLYKLESGQSPVLLSTITQPVAAAFDETGSHLYAVDLDQQRVLEFASGSGPSEFAALAQDDGPPLNPVGLAVSAGSRYLLLPDRATRAVRVYDIASRNLVNTIGLDFEPTRFEALSTGPTFLLNGDNSNEWLLILDARQLPAAYFVPSGQVEPL